MNKTVNINLGGMFFHIDEDAYQKLSHYFDAIKRSLTNSNGQDEIIKDIEMRIAELFLEKNGNGRQVIGLKEVDDVIAVMGQPEDYRIDNDEEENKTYTSYNYEGAKTSKKLYRDIDNSMLGGVLSGLGHYFGIDKVWLRIILLVLVLFYGTGILAYIILWIVMPAAQTTTEKLEMTGEPVNISNIEKKVREGFENVSQKIKNANYDKMGNHVKTGADKIASTAGNIFLQIFNVIAKIIGILLILGTLPVLAILLISVFTIGSTSFMPIPWKELFDAGMYLDFPLWTIGLIIFFLIGIPVFYVMILGFKLLITNMKSLGNYINYTLLSIWLISIAMLIYLFIAQSTQLAVAGKISKKEIITLSPSDTLDIKFYFNQKYSNSADDHIGFNIVKDEDNNDMIFSDNVSVEIIKSEDRNIYIEIIKEARSNSLTEAKNIAEKIQYNYNFDGKTLSLNNYLLTNKSQKLRDQNIKILLHLPENLIFKLDKNFSTRNNSDYYFFHFEREMSNEIFRVEKNQVTCISCIQTIKETESAEITNDTISIETNTKNNTQTKGLTFDENGKIIKK